MSDPGSFGYDHQEKILEMLMALKNDIQRLRSLAQANTNQNSMTRNVSGSMETFQSKISSLEDEFEYLFELLKSKHLMMQDNLKYIKQLEAELEELKAQKL